MPGTSFRASIAASLLLVSASLGVVACSDGASDGQGGATSSTDATSAAGPGVTSGTGSASGSVSGTTAATTATGSTGEGGGDDVCSHPRPGPDNTGVPVNVTLTPSGSITVDTDGAVVEGLDIDGAITVLANDVTIKNCRIRSSDYYPIRYFDNDNTGLLVEDTEIEGLTGDVTAGLSFANYTARRLNIHGSADGLKADSNVLIEDCWVHDLSNGEGEHNDCVQSTGGKGVTIRHSDLSGASNAAVQAGDEGDKVDSLDIECSWLFGGGWTLNIRGEGDTRPVNTRIVDNRFGRDAGYGPMTLDDPDPTVTGNVYDDNDEPITY